jgi:hypothetical protein
MQRSIWKSRVRREREKGVQINKNGRMTQTSLNIVTVASHHLDKWSCVKTHIAKRSGFIGPVFRKKSCQRNGTAKTVDRRSEWLYFLGVLFILFIRFGS